MKNTLICFLLLTMLSCHPENKNSFSPNEVEKEKITLRFLKEVEWPKAYREQDTLLLDRILGDDFQMINGDGNWSNKKEEIDRIKKSPWPVDSFYFEIKRMEILENGTAIICGTGHVLKDSIYAVYQSSNFLIKRDGQWKAFSSHVSGYKEVADKISVQ